MAKLIGVSTTTDGYYEIDPLTGVAAFVATSDRNVSRAGLAWLNGALYASDLRLEPSLTPYQTVRVDLATGGSTPVSSQGGSSNWHALAANQSAGVLYAVDTDQGTNLWTLTPGGTPTKIGDTMDIRGLAYDDTNGVLYGVYAQFGPLDNIKLYTLDTATGAATLVGDMGVPDYYNYGVVSGLAYDEDAGVLYMVNDPDLSGAAPSSLYTINVATGAATLIGSTGVDAIDGLTWVADGPVAPPPPDPGPVTTILGTTLGNAISGTAGRDTIYDFAGNDHIAGGGGDDTITAGSGSDWIETGPGADRIILSNGSGIDIIDVVSGGGGPPYRDIIEFVGLTESQLWGYRSGDHYAITELQSGPTGDNFTFLDFYTVADPFDYMIVPLSGGGNRIVTPGTDTNAPLGPDMQQGRLLRFGTTGADTITDVPLGEHDSIYWSGQGDDTLTGGAAPVMFFAGEGADTLTSNSPVEGSTLVGGSGGDIYNVAVGASAIILDLPSIGGSTDSDQLNAPGLSLNAASFRAWQVDGRHLLMQDTANDTTVLIFDWTDANQLGSRIESYQFGDGTLSHSQFASALPSNAGYQGNVTWESLGETTAEMTQAIVNLRVIAGGNSGSNLNLTIGGTSGDDDLRGTYGLGFNTLIGGPGNDLLRGGVNSDYYIFRPGDGQDTVDNVAFALSGELNYLRFGGGVSLGQIYGEQHGNDLVLHYGASDSVRLLGWYGPSAALARQVMIGTSDVNVLRLVSAETVGGPASEIVVGTAAGDTLDGGTGRDRYVGGGGNDTIDGHAGYEIAYYAGPRASYSVVRNGGTLTVTDLDGAANGGDDGVDTLISIERLKFSDGYLQIRSNPHDLNGDARGDLLWTSAGGSLAQWQQSGTAYIGGGVFSAPPSEWTIAGLADFNGDGAADILWQHASGALAEWHMNGTTYIGGGVISGPGGDWTLAALADFNGDARADILWRNGSGALAQWHMDGTAYIGGGVISGPGGGWSHVATADFNGDGKADLLWRDGDTLAMWFMDGTSYIGGGVLSGAPGWTLEAAADFSGDGKADLLWSNGSGLAQWHMDGTSYIGGGVFSAAGAGWSIASIADFEGDGHADLLWEHSSGALSLWAMDGTSVIGGGALGVRPAGWDLVNPGQMIA